MFKPGPLYERRKEILKLLQEVPLQTGDIVYSASNATGPLSIPFGSLIQTFTKSPYSHATLILCESDEIYVIDVSDWGTRKLRVVDWFDNWGTTDFCVVRLVDIDETMSGCLTDSINAFLRDDPSYDFTRIEKEPDVHFAHARGFVAKTSAAQIDRVKELLGLARV